MVQQVKVLSGITGTGKTFLANKLLDNFATSTNYRRSMKAHICSTDSYFENKLTNGGWDKYNFNPALLSLAHARCFKNYLNCLNEDYDFIVIDNTNASEIEIAPYMLAASAFGYNAEVITIVCNSSKELEKITARNIHGMTIENVTEQLGRMALRKLAPWWKHTELPIEGI